MNEQEIQKLINEVFDRRITPYRIALEQIRKNINNSYKRIDKVIETLSLALEVIDE